MANCKAGFLFFFFFFSFGEGLANVLAGTNGRTASCEKILSTLDLNDYLNSDKANAQPHSIPGLQPPVPGSRSAQVRHLRQLFGTRDDFNLSPGVPYIWKPQH